MLQRKKSDGVGVPLLDLLKLCAWVPVSSWRSTRLIAIAFDQGLGVQVGQPEYLLVEIFIQLESFAVPYVVYLQSNIFSMLLSRVLGQTVNGETLR